MPKKLLEVYDVSVDLLKLEYEFYDYLSVDSQTMDAVAQFRAIHYAWLKERKIVLDNVKVILWHPHRLERKYRKFFNSMKNRKVLLTCRDPLDALVSTYRHWDASDMFFMPDAAITSYFKHPWIISYFVSTMETYSFYKNYVSGNSFVSLEKLNENTEFELRKLAAFLGISYLPKVLNESTCLGKPAFQTKTTLVKGFSKTKNYKDEKFDELLIHLIGYLFNQSSNEFGYEIIDVSNISKYQLLKKICCSNLWALIFHICIRQISLPNQKKESNYLSILRSIKYILDAFFNMIILTLFLIRSAKN